MCFSSIFSTWTKSCKVDRLEWNEPKVEFSPQIWFWNTRLRFVERSEMKVWRYLLSRDSTIICWKYFKTIIDEWLYFSRVQWAIDRSQLEKVSFDLVRDHSNQRYSLQHLSHFWKHLCFYNIKFPSFWAWSRSKFTLNTARAQLT